VIGAILLLAASTPTITTDEQRAAARAVLMAAFKNDEAGFNAPLANKPVFQNATIRGRVTKSAPLTADRLQTFTSGCTLADWGEARDVSWVLAWKCGENYHEMRFDFSGARIARVVVSEGAPWVYMAGTAFPAFPDTFEGDR